MKHPESQPPLAPELVLTPPSAESSRGRRPSAGAFEAQILAFEARQRAESKAVRRICRILSDLPDEFQQENVLEHVQEIVMAHGIPPSDDDTLPDDPGGDLFIE